MNHRIRSRGEGEGGVITVVAALLLCAGVIFILIQTLQTAGTRSIDTSRQLDSTAALMLAESGLQRAQYAITASQVTMTASVCTALANTGPYALGRGSFRYGSATASPVGCSFSGTPCDTCTLEVAGTVGATSRTLNLVMNMGVQNGVAGRGTNVQMVLRNTYTVPALGIFNLAWQRQGSGGNAEASLCPTCANEWNVESSSGNPSVGGMGVEASIAASTNSQLVTQTLSLARDYAEVGALFPSTTSASPPTLIGSYWDDTNGHTGSQTVNKNSATGQVANGVATGGAACSTPPNPSVHNGTQQACTSWCSGGDTLVFGVAGRSTSLSDEVTSVIFNTTDVTGFPAQNLALQRVVHFPSSNAVLTNASGTIFSEIWWAHNPAYMQSPAAGASTYPTQVYGTVGATLTINPKMQKNDTSMTVSAITGQVCVGDAVAGAGLSSTIKAVPGAGPCSTTAGTYLVNDKATANNITSAATSSTTLYVTANAQSRGTLAASAATPQTSGGSITITAGPAGGNYTLATAANYPLQFFGQGNGATVYVPAGTTLPSVGTTLSLYGGTGVLGAGTTVQSVGTNSYTLSQPPATALSGATLCGGTCAMFSNPGNAGANTTFTVNQTAGTRQWSGGFMCLSGVDTSLIVPVQSFDTSAKSWAEAIQ